MVYALLLTVVTMTGPHHLTSDRRFETREACEAYAADTIMLLKASSYVLGVKARCKARGKDA